MIFTGHSLGAALSQLGAFDLRNHFNLKEKKTSTACNLRLAKSI
ncbi:MAG: hypothetical protein H6925_01355 [Holosporaceae bacterium]|nr:MAG: hypothetical protein H6925_01355 [Holosporaceae bacterium]